MSHVHFPSDNTGGKPLNQSKFSRHDSPTMVCTPTKYGQYSWTVRLSQNVVSLHQEPQEQHQATDRIAMHATSHPICEPHTEDRLLRLPCTQPPVTFPQKVKNSWKNLFKTSNNKTASIKPAQVMECFTAYFVSIYLHHWKSKMVALIQLWLPQRVSAVKDVDG